MINAIIHPKPWKPSPATMTGIRCDGDSEGAISVAIVALSIMGKTGRIQAGVMDWMVRCGPAKRSRYWDTAARKAKAT